MNFEQTMKLLQDEMAKPKGELKDGGLEMVLATSAKDAVSARSVSVAMAGENFYILSFNQSTKAKQLAENPNVALAKDAMQITGKATVYNSPEEMKEGAKALQHAFSQWYDLYAPMPGCIFIEVKPKEVIFLVGEQAYRLDYEKRTAEKIESEY